MTGRRVCIALVATLLAALAGCGGGQRAPRLSQLPLVSGARVVAQEMRCDRGANAFCSLELVVVNPSYRSPDRLLKAEHDRLKAAGWTGTNGDIGDESAAESPGHRLRVTYATADGDLKGIDLGWVKRSRKITLALSQALFGRSAALSLLLERGPGSV